MISNFTKKSLLVRTIILLCAPFLFFSDADAARRRSVSGPTRVQRAAAIVTAPVGKTEPSPAAAAQIAELKAQMARNAAEEVKEDAAEAEEDRLEAIEDEEERREDASAAKEEAAREKRAEEYRKLIES